MFFSSTFDPTRDIPDLTGRVVLVSGANTGMGYQIAECLAVRGAKVYVGARSAEKGAGAIARIEAAHPELKGKGALVYLPLEMGTVTGTKKGAASFLGLESRLDLLINNAGAMDARYTINSEGIESAMTSNHLGPFILTNTLLPLLIKTASVPGSDVRIITVGSEMQNFAPKDAKFASLADLNNLCAPTLEVADGYMARQRRYGLTKLANTLFASELQRRLLLSPVPSAHSIISLSLHPGLVATDKGKSMVPWFLKPLGYLVGKSPLQGATAALFAATAPEVREEVGKYQGSYLLPYGKLAVASEAGRSEVAATELWETTERVIASVSKGGVKSVAI